MLGFLIQRVLQAAAVMVIISVLVFVGVFAIGNPIDVLIAPDATQDIRLDTIRRYGFDQPLWKQYLNFVTSLVQGNFGRSFVFNMPVLDLILSRLPATLELTLAAVIGATIVGVPLGMYAGYRPHAITSRAIMGLSVIGFSVPTFWVGLLLIMGFAVELGWLPAGGRGDTVAVLGVQWSVLTLSGWSHLVLPALTLSLFRMALMIRMARAGMREAMLSDYVRFARAQGLSDTKVIFGHVLKNISIPLVTVFGLELAATLAFAVVTETVFNWPGMGKLIIESITSLDRPVMVAYLILVVLLFVGINLVVELTYGLLDPRVRAR